MRARTTGRRLVGLIGLLVSSACSSAPGAGDDVVGTATEAITHGEPTASDPSVVALLAGGAVTCTGTLVSRVVVLTAAHCLDDPKPERVALATGASIAVAALIPHPDYDGLALNGDIGVLVLASPVALDATSLSTPLGDATAVTVGAGVRLVGYGKSAPGDLQPRKRTGEARIAAVLPTALYLDPSPAGPCSGDSGGPAFLTTGGAERIAGVVSSGDPTCTGRSHFTRVDAFMPWLTRQVALAEPHTQATGARCSNADNCSEGSCLTPPDAPLHAYCTRPCSDDAGCPRAMRCEDARCAFALPSPGAAGAACAADDDCESILCASPDGTTDRAACAALCVDGFTSCGAGARCGADGRHAGASACFASDEDGAPAQGCAVVPAVPARSNLLAIVAALALFAASAARRSKRLSKANPAGGRALARSPSKEIREVSR